MSESGDDVALAFPLTLLLLIVGVVGPFGGWGGVRLLGQLFKKKKNIKQNNFFYFDQQYLLSGLCAN